jgi:hypothetical protein
MNICEDYARNIVKNQDLTNKILSRAEKEKKEGHNAH